MWLVHLDKFLKNYIREITLPNPEDSSKPSIFLIHFVRDLYSDYIDKIKEAFNRQGLNGMHPVSWGKFHEFWNENYKFCKRL